MVKKFTTDCQLSGQKSPVTFYIGEPAVGSHPLAFQSKWLGKERNGTVPPEIMEAFEKLKVVAEENRVSFEELCSYVIEELNYNSTLVADSKQATAIAGGANRVDKKAVDQDVDSKTETVANKNQAVNSQIINKNN